MATAGQAETPLKVNNCDSSNNPPPGKLVNGSADPDFNSPENNNAMKEGYNRYNHHAPGINNYDHHQRGGQNNSHHHEKGGPPQQGQGGMDAPPPPDYQGGYGQQQQYPPGPYRGQQGYDHQIPPPPPHHNNGPDSYQQQHQQQQGYPPPMRYPGKPMPGQGQGPGAGPPQHGYPPGPGGVRPSYPGPGGMGTPPGQSISQQPSGQTPTLNQLLQSPGGANAGASGAGGHRYPPPPPSGYEQHPSYSPNPPPNHASSQGPTGWPPNNRPPHPPNSYAHPPPFQQQQPQQPMYRPGAPGPGGSSRSGGPPPPQSSSGQPQQPYYQHHQQGPPPPSHHPGYPPHPSQQSSHYPPPPPHGQQRYPSPSPGMRPPDNQQQPSHYPPQHPPPGMPPPDSGNGGSEPPKSTPPPPPSPSLGGGHGQNPPSPQQSPRSTPHAQGSANSSNNLPPPSSPSHRPQGPSPSNTYPPPPDVGEVTGCNSNDSSGANAGQPGGPRPSPSPTGSAGSRSMSPAVGNQNIPMPPRPSSSQSDGSNARMSQSPMPGQGGSYPGQQSMAPPPHHMYPSGGKHGHQAGMVPPGPPGSQGHYPHQQPPPQQHWSHQQQQHGGPPGQGGYGVRPPQQPGPGGMMSPYPPAGGQGMQQNSYGPPRQPMPNHVGGPPPPAQQGPPGGSQYNPYPPQHYPQPSQPPQVWSGAPGGAAPGTPPPPRSQMQMKLQHKLGYGPSPHGYPMMGPPGQGPQGSSPSQTPPPSHPHHPGGMTDSQDGGGNPPNLVSVGPDGANLDEVSQQSTLSNNSGTSGGEDGPPMPKLRPEGGRHYPTTPQSNAVPSPASMNSTHEDYGEMNSPGWPRTPASPGLNSHPPPPSEHFRGKNKQKADSLGKLYDMDDNPERRMFLDKLIPFMEENNTPIASCPTISKNPLDLFKLYLLVKERGGFLEVSKNKTWKDIAGSLGIGASSSAAYTLRKHYTKHLFPFECKFDRGGVDPQPLINQVETSTKKKGKTVAPVPSPGSSNSQDSFPGPNNNTNSSSMDGFNSPPSSNYPTYGQPPSGSEYGPPGNAGSAPSPLARPPGPPPPNSQPPQHPGDKSQISVSNPFDDQYPQHYQLQSRPNYYPPYSSQQPAGFQGPPGNYPPYPNQGEQYPGRPQVPPPHDGYPGQGYGRYPPYGGDSSNSSPQNTPGYPAQPTPHGQHIPPSSQSSGAGERYPSPAEGGAVPPAGYPPRPYPPTNATQGVPPGSSPVPPPHSGHPPPPNGYPSQNDPYYGSQPQSDQGYPPGGKHMPPPQGIRYPPSGKEGPPGQFPGYPSPSQASQQQRVPPYGWPSGGHFPGQPRGYPPPPQGASPSPHTPPQGGTPGPAPSPGAPASTPPQQAISPQPWNASTPGRPGPPPVSSAQGPPPPPPGATWPQQPPDQRYGASPGGSMMTPLPPSSVVSSQQPPWTPPPQAPSPSSRSVGGRSPYPPGGKPSGPPGDMFRGYGPSPSSLQPSGAPPKGSIVPPPQVAFASGPIPGPSGAPVKKEVIFPPESVEAVTPVLTRRRKLHKSDVAPVEAWRIMMSLKSGLLAEVTWALDVLNVLLYDDYSVSYFSLTYLPGLLDILLEHLRRALIQLFGQSVGIELSGDRLDDSSKKTLQWFERAEKVEEEEPDLGTPGMKFPRDGCRTVILQGSTNYTMISRIKGKKVRIVSRDDEPFIVSGTRDWDVDEKFRNDPDIDQLSGTMDVTKHIVSYFTTDLPVPLRIVRDLKREDEEEKKRKNSPSESEELLLSRKPLPAVVNLDLYKSETRLPIIAPELQTNGPSPAPPSTTDATSNPVTPVGTTVNMKKLENGPLSSSETSSEEKDIKTDVSEKKNCSLFPPPPSTTVLPKMNSIVQKKFKRLDDLLGRIRKEQHEDENALSEAPVIPVLPAVEPEPPSANIEEPTPPPVEPAILENGLSDTVLTEGGDHSNLSAANSENTCDSSKHFKNMTEVKIGDLNVRDPGATLKRKRIEDYEDECYTRDESSLYLVTESQDSLARRCLSILNIIRNLTFVPGNEAEFGKCIPFLSLVGKLILLHHDHPLKKKSSKNKTTVPSKMEEEEMDTHKVDSDKEENDKMEVEPSATPEEPSIPEIKQEMVDAQEVDEQENHKDETMEESKDVEEIKDEEVLDEEGLFAEDPAADLATSTTIDVDSCTSLTNDCEWWWDYVHHIREHVLVMIANISGQMDLSQFSEEVSRPILDGLLHWAVCPAAYGQDPFPTLSPGAYLTPQRLALEALVKLSVIQGNVDLLLATPPYSRIERLCHLLCRSLCRTEEQVMREFALNLLYYLSAADTGVARTIAIQNPCISLLISFIEQAEHNALSIANNHGFSVLRENPEAMGTSLDMLRRAAMTLLNLARHPDNRPLFVQHEPRLLQLVMSQILEQKVAAMVAQVLFQCSTPDATCSQKYLYASNLDTFYTPLFSRSRNPPPQQAPPQPPHPQSHIPHSFPSSRGFSL